MSSFLFYLFICIFLIFVFFTIQITQASLGRENSLENSNLVFMDWKDDAKENNLEDNGAFFVSCP